jgi:hypothetical protein
MGYGRWDPQQWQSYHSTHVAGKSQAQVMNTLHLVADLDPKNILLRESRDSVQNPLSTPIIVAGDVTGSMGKIAFTLMQDGLDTFARSVYDRLPVTDPHLMFMAVGDAGSYSYGDKAPLQVTQFEADIRIADQLKQIWVESGGLGNGWESYHLPWWFAANRTSIDCWEKRKQKGVLITYGDEGVPPDLTPEQMKRVLGVDSGEAIPTRALLQMAQRKWDVYHCVILNGSYASSVPGVVDEWKEILGENVIPVTDESKLPEILVSVLQVRAGVDRNRVASSWSGKTAVAVANAVAGLAAKPQQPGGGVMTL